MQVNSEHIDKWLALQSDLWDELQIQLLPIPTHSATTRNFAVL